MVNKSRQPVASKQNLNFQSRNEFLMKSVAAAEPDGRSSWIAHTAYHKAELRGFQPSHEMDDWLAAEAEFATQRGH